MVAVPEEFRLVTAAAGLTAQVTALGDARLWVEERNLERIVVRGTADVEFDYLVNGVRRGFADLPVVVENLTFRPRERGRPFGDHLPPELRAMLVANKVLRPDYTPNEDTVARLGWRLTDVVDL